MALAQSSALWSGVETSRFKQAEMLLKSLF